MNTNTRKNIIINQATLFWEILVLFFLMPVNMVQGNSVDIFPDHPNPPAEDPFDGDYVLNGRYIDVNFEELEHIRGAMLESGEPQQVMVRLFDEVVLDIILDRVEHSVSGGWTLSGKVVGDEFSLVTLSRQDDIFLADFRTSDKIFQVEYYVGTHRIIELDNFQLIEDQPPLIPLLTEGPVSALATSDDDGSRIDVLVVYTADALNYVGGSSAMQARINSYISETNSSYSNSLINQRLVLVGTDQIAYDETNFVFLTALERITQKGDGHLDNVHALRDVYNADVVVMLVENLSYCGQAWLLRGVNTYGISRFSTNAFSVVSVNNNCIYTFAHETGHNLGGCIMSRIPTIQVHMHILMDTGWGILVLPVSNTPLCLIHVMEIMFVSLIFQTQTSTMEATRLERQIMLILPVLSTIQLQG
ncbi:MAG: hypothetical protein JEZ06_11855 [Anaerolineaceae bacterium]|nr:hypothetical protein [Anaerolineaceae bacterium]